MLLCPLRLQKELYYCQGWHLALLGEPLFREPIEAWVNGPVVPAVYDQFKGKRDGIRPEEAGEPTEKLGRVGHEFLEMIWRQYTCFTPRALIQMTHAEPAWKEARAGLPPDAKSSNELSLATMKAYFEQQMWEQARKAVPPGFPVANPAEAWRAERELEEHPERGRPMDEVFRSLKARRKPS